MLLRWIVYLGFAVSLIGLLLSIFFVLNYFFRDPYPGWTTLGILILVVGGVIIVTLGVVGLYVGRIYSQVKERPLYVVESRVTRSGGRSAGKADVAAPDRDVHVVEP